MSGSSRLLLDPRACDRCGQCLSACDRNAIRVGRTYLAVDWTRCDGCGACAKACAAGAIAMRAHVRAPERSTARTGGAGKPGAASQGTPRSRSATAKATKAPKAGKRGGFQWTLLEAAAMLSVTFSAFMVKEALSESVAGRLPEALATAGRVGVLALYYAIQVAVLIWLVRRRGGEVLAALGLKVGDTGPARFLVSTGMVIAALLGTRLIASLYVYVTQYVGLMPTTTVDLPMLFGRDAAGLLLAVLMVVVVGPVVEEAVFRAALLEGLAGRLGVWPATLVQAGLFAAFHRSTWLLFPMFVLGVALGWLAHKRQSLWPPIAVHALYNAITVAAAFLVAR